MTFPRAKTARQRPHRRRNRKRPASFWRRLPSVRPVLAGLQKAVIGAIPGVVAIAVVASVGAGLYYGYGFVTTSERFSVQAVEVRGNHAVSSERISSMLNIHPGDNIFRIDLGAMSEILEANPMIAHASVSRRLPDTLLVDIDEHQPVALVDIGGLYLADAQGAIFKRASIADGEGADLPVITGLERAAYSDNPEYIQAEIRRALDAVAVYHRSGEEHSGEEHSGEEHSGDGHRDGDRMSGAESDSGEGRRPAIGEVNLHPRHGITFTTYERAVAVRVGHGDSDDIRANLQVFDTAWRALTPYEKQRVRIVYADTRNRPDRVTVGFEPVE